jgi:orotate phosphoribosyltransferase
MPAPTTATTGDLGRRMLAAAQRPGPYRLADGTVLDRYFDPYLLASDPALLTEAARALAELLPATARVLAAPVMAAVLPATALSLHTGLPAAYVRARPKAHGTDRRIEGADVAGRDAVLVDDTARTGTSLLVAARTLREAGAAVQTALCLVDRGLGAAALLRAEGIDLRAVVRAPHREPR